MLESLKHQLPEFAKDARLNLIKVLDFEQADGLSKAQILGVALAVSYHLSDKKIIHALESIEEDANITAAAKLAASLMAMSNIYYRFIHLSDQKALGQIPAGLRMQGLANPGIDKATFEMMCLGVSILNGCGACISAHNKQLLQHGFQAAALARIGRIAAVLHAVHVSLRLN